MHHNQSRGIAVFFVLCPAFVRLMRKVDGLRTLVFVLLGQVRKVFVVILYATYWEDVFERCST